MDFYEELAKTKNKIRWSCGTRYTRNGEPRGGSGRIRGRIRCGPHKDKTVCPIAAVFLFETGKYNDGSLWGDCSKWFIKNYLGPDTCLIVDAADSLDHTAHDTRQKLLAALGFSYVSQDENTPGYLQKTEVQV